MHNSWRVYRGRGICSSGLLIAVLFFSKNVILGEVLSSQIEEPPKKMRVVGTDLCKLRNTPVVGFLSKFQDIR